ncbi:hypothetical protein HETIRDRAFT_105552 [Heterobasidion irregulare TC 32-1]|uniref:Uncharacterized protein n=1 Tax=Heterobasidion irregulare (strain TC 32-1) TaxID=747525 RepID=W4JWQ6_HETIT|nr:uncharacterized protein HETIRDRAFT_105552 [Heterobasidion irregulare TC 32-1]ETW77291.1 hypothetical protein HETIRDRAFT_105552 [Heterobasidion irregulare TC 32-1]
MKAWETHVAPSSARELNRVWCTTPIPSGATDAAPHLRKVNVNLDPLRTSILGVLRFVTDRRSNMLPPGRAMPSPALLLNL